MNFTHTNKRKFFQAQELVNQFLRLNFKMEIVLHYLTNGLLIPHIDVKKNQGPICRGGGLGGSTLPMIFLTPRLRRFELLGGRF